VKVNYSRERLLKEAVATGDVKEIDGVLFAWTGLHTGRSPNAKCYEIDENSSTIDWQNNKSITPAAFDTYWEKFRSFFAQKAEDVYFESVEAVRDPRRRLRVNVYTEFARHALFTKNMFIPDKPLDPGEYNAAIVKNVDYEVYHFPTLLDEPTVLISITKKKILISGTLYSGEIKKSVFSVLNYHFPMNNELPMHCSVNVDKNRENPAIFFGLSGTGKTTLSSDPNRILIGDDEHAWTSHGLTNFEDGCYAKTINLSSIDEPEIFNACYTPGTILENVDLKNGLPDFNSAKYTKNGRASYKTTTIPNSDSDGYVNLHPKNIIMLTCDAFGVLPPVAKLTVDEAVEHFSLGYTAKVAGTESGIDEPIATFSPCFGGPFMPLPTTVYAKILREKIEQHNVQCWLVNTGWTGGSYGQGNRIAIKTTRSIIDSILDESLASVDVVFHEHTGLSIPLHAGISSDVLFPERGWKNKDEYKKKVKKLNEMFLEAKSNA